MLTHLLISSSGYYGHLNLETARIIIESPIIIHPSQLLSSSPNNSSQTCRADCLAPAPRWLMMASCTRWPAHSDVTLPASVSSSVKVHRSYLTIKTASYLSKIVGKHLFSSKKFPCTLEMCGLRLRPDCSSLLYLILSVIHCKLFGSFLGWDARVG